MAKHQKVTKRSFTDDVQPILVDALFSRTSIRERTVEDSVRIVDEFRRMLMRHFHTLLTEKNEAYAYEIIAVEIQGAMQLALAEGEYDLHLDLETLLNEYAGRLHSTPAWLLNEKHTIDDQ